MKKPIKRILQSVCCVAPIAFLVSFATTWVEDIPISIVGSSGVKPFSEALGKEYQLERQDIDITVDAGGSGFGIEQVAKGFASIGNASKDPYKAVKGNEEVNHQKEWEENRIKTVTIGWEAICILYVPPQGLASYSPEHLNLALRVSSSTISMFYQSFSGWFWEEDQTGLKTIPTLEPFINKDVLSEKEQTIFKNTTITPYVRTGGGHTSGTASSFFDKSHFDVKLSPKQKAAFTDGSYGPDFKYIETDEANSRAYDLFHSNNEGKNRTPGSMVYVSSAFVESNRKTIEEDGFGIMAYQKDNEAVAEYSIKNVQEKKYLWFRPLNSMVALPENPTENRTASMEFLWWILFGKSEKPWELPFADRHEGLFDRIGGIPLSNDQFVSMVKDGIKDENFWNNFWTSDFTLNNGQWPDDGSFGAKE